MNTVPDLSLIRDALVQGRAALRTALHDEPEDLENEARARVLAARIEKITEALATLPPKE